MIHLPDRLSLVSRSIRLGRDVVGEPFVVMAQRADGGAFEQPLLADHDRHMIVLAAGLHDARDGADHESRC